jgi:hypothetical protein
MDDYYELLGVEDDAPVDDIRAAYRDKKAAVDTSAGDDAKSDVAKLNKAWNVLSDPYQRGRYDQQRATANDDDESDLDDGDDDEGAPVAPRRKPSRAAERAETRRNARQVAKPTIPLPAGAQFPTTRQRLIAMMIDLGVLFALVIVATFIVAPAVDKALHKPIVDRVDRLNDELKKVTDRANALDDAAGAADKKGKASPEAKAAHKKADDYRDRELKHATDAYEKESRKLLPLNTSITAGGLLIGLLYLVIPSARTGQTLGKRLQGIRVIRVDGSPLGFVAALRRYGLILLTTFLLVFLTPFGIIGAAIVLYGVTTWTRNANQQGVQDRITKTLVVTADES